MSNKIKGILIDAVNRTVKEVEVSGLEGLQGSVGGSIAIAHSFMDDGDMETDTLFVDDEGLLKSPKHFFSFEGAHQPFAGNGIIVGLNEEGDTIDTTQNLEAIKSKVSFHTLSDLRNLH